MARAASAQTVIVRSAPPGASIELTFDGGRAATATADNFGDATLAVPSPAERAVQFHVDTCGTGVKVLLVSRGLQPAAAEPGCSRVDLPSAFSMHPTTTFVLDLNGPSTTIHVTQGAVPIEWVWRGTGPPRGPGLEWGTPDTGLSLGGSVGFSGFSKAGDISCGTAGTCQKSGLTIAAGFNADYWITKYVAAHIGYWKPGDVTVNGSGDGYRFNSRLQTRILTIGAKAGVGVGPARLYALGGMNRHESTLDTTETIDDKTITVNNAPQTVTGGTQSFGQKTQGWNLMFGGGAESWVRSWIAFYGEVVIPKIKGSPTAGGEGGIDDRATLAMVGVRVRIAR